MKFIPNENSWIGFAASLANPAQPTVAEIGSAVDLTALVSSLTASTTGNTVSTPTFDTKFETSIPGTVSSQFSMDCYRDDDPTADLAWSTLPRETTGFIVIARFGGTPVANAKVEVWPIAVTSRSHAQMTSNTAVMFTVTASVPSEPNENVSVHS